MCLAIPAKIIRINGGCAQVEMMGVQKLVNIMLLEDAEIGDNVMVHAGYAINKIDEAYYNFLEEALEEMLCEMP